MSDLALFDLDEAPAWVPIARHGVTIQSLVQEPRCRDCGRKGGSGSHGCGGADRRGIWDLCDDCASLDGCLTRESHTPGMHCSSWGITHPATEHDAMVKAQAKRRAAYLRKVDAA